MNKRLAIVGVAALMTISGQVYAHSPLLNCFDNGDKTITCEGGFSDGSSATGVKMRVKSAAGKVLIKGNMSQDSEFSFNKPAGTYTVAFDAGAGHIVEINGDDIVE